MGKILGIASCIIFLALFAIAAMWSIYILPTAIIDPWDEPAPEDIAAYCWYIDYDPTGKRNEIMYRMKTEPIIIDNTWLEVTDAWFKEEQDRGWDTLIRPFRDVWTFEPSVLLHSDADVRVFNRC